MESNTLVVIGICTVAAFLVIGIPEATGIFALYTSAMYSINKASFYSMMFLLINYGVVYILKLSAINYLNVLLALSIIFLQVHYGNNRLYNRRDRSLNLILIIAVTTPLYYLLEAITNYLIFRIPFDGILVSLFNILWFVFANLIVSFAVFESDMQWITIKKLVRFDGSESEKIDKQTSFNCYDSNSNNREAKKVRTTHKVKKNVNEEFYI